MKALGNRWMAGGCREAEPRLLNVVERDRSFAPRRRFEAEYARGGWPAFWLEELNLAKEEAGHPGAIWGPAGQNRFTSPWYMARRLARLGRTGEALDALELAHEARHHLVATLAVEPLFVSLRQTPRFQSLLRQTAALPVTPK